MEPEHCWTSRAHDLTPLLETVMSPKDSDSAFTGGVDISFSGSKRLVSLKLGNAQKTPLCVFTLLTTEEFLKE